MTQISSNTLTYDQVYLKVRDYFSKEVRNQFATNQQKIEEYKKLVSDIYETVGGPVTQFVPYIKGEPPTSSKYNSFSASVGNDFALVSKQLDYLNAKTVNAYNLFVQEIEAEKNYLERISSKAKILQMYSQAPADDLVYLGDSFDNQDQVNVSLIPVGMNPNIENGSFTLPISRIRPWSPRSIKINQSVSNGFLGNNHQVVKSVNSDQTEVYEYIYKSNRTLASLSGIGDENPLTYFEYDAINVDRSSNAAVNSAVISNDEFGYLSNRKVVAGKTEGELIDWSSFDMSNPVKLSLIFECGAPTLANTFTILPYFGSTGLIKVTSVKATLQNGDVTEVLNGTIYVGSSFSPLNLQIANNYFYNKATIRFSELRVLKFEVSIEQDAYQDVDILHAYWKPNYQTNQGIDSPFYGLSRFNPSAFSSDVYELIEYDKYSLVPQITNPNEFKDKDRISKVVRVRLKKKPVRYDAYAISMKTYVNGSPNSTKVYFYNFIGSGSNRSFVWVPDTASLFEPSAGDVQLAGSAKYAPSSAELVDDLASVNSYLASLPNGTATTGYNTYRFSDIVIEPVTYTAVTQVLGYSVPITLEKELYKAKRKSIGIRDISFTYETYADAAEVVSTSYNFDTPIESLMISSETNVDNSYSDKVILNYFISVNDSSWIQISPVQLSANGIAEVLVFNKNIPINYQIPGVAYINYPEVPTEINSVKVKIQMFKDRNYNITPVVYSYKLIAKVKKR
jgi:hypothetical protein